MGAVVVSTRPARIIQFVDIDVVVGIGDAGDGDIAGAEYKAVVELLVAVGELHEGGADRGVGPAGGISQRRRGCGARGSNR